MARLIVADSILLKMQKELEQKKKEAEIAAAQAAKAPAADAKGGAKK